MLRLVLQPHQQAFVDLLVRYEVVRFGEFTLKSGRKSPYFVNAGQLRTGVAIAGLGRAYAAEIERANLRCELVFGPSYKGVPLAVATAIGLAERGRDIPYGFDRKEAKDHGEGGVLVGAPLHGRVLIVDDVITAGTAIRESLELIRHHGAQPVGVLVALDRQERGSGAFSAAQEVSAEFDIPVIAIVGFGELLALTGERSELADELPRLQEYRRLYGV